MNIDEFRQAKGLLNKLAEIKYKEHEKTIRTRTGYLYYTNPALYFFDFDEGGFVARQDDKTLIATPDKTLLKIGTKDFKIFVPEKRITTQRKVVLMTAKYGEYSYFWLVPFASGIYEVVAKDIDCIDDDNPEDCIDYRPVIKFPAKVYFRRAEIDDGGAYYDGFRIPFDEKQIKRIFRDNEDIIQNFGFSAL